MPEVPHVFTKCDVCQLESALPTPLDAEAVKVEGIGLEEIEPRQGISKQSLLQ